MITKILTAPIRALKTISLYIVNIGLRVRFDFGRGWAFSAGIYRPDYDFSLGVHVALLENVLGPYSDITLNLGWLSVEVHVSYGYGEND